MSSLIGSALFSYTYLFVLLRYFSADGYVRSDGITAVYLQKKKDAKRVYCTAVHAKTNSDGHKSEGTCIYKFYADDLYMSRSDCAHTGLSNAIRVHAHICACPNKAAQSDHSSHIFT